MRTLRPQNLDAQSRRPAAPRPERRRGVAALEFALAAPLLVLLILGTIDLGQFINVGQVVSNSSRAGARKAVRFESKTVADVRQSVLLYLGNYFSDSSASEIASATTVTVYNSAGAQISGTNLGNLGDGDELSVQVDFDFSAVRWLNGLGYLDGRTVRYTTVMRRQ